MLEHPEEIVKFLRNLRWKRNQQFDFSPIKPLPGQTERTFHVLAGAFSHKPYLMKSCPYVQTEYDQLKEKLQHRHMPNPESCQKCFRLSGP